MSRPTAVAADAGFMARALELAGLALGETNPNPLVGCVVVRAGRVVGEGHHARAGAPHAEVVALERAGRQAEGAVLYVNLEPCAHFGRTPPCAPRVVAAGVRRVVVAVRDPDPRVSGRGLAALRAAGLAVTTGVLRREATRQNRRFLIAARRGRPYVLLKAALTLDGRIATSRGESRWLTSPRQRRAARRLRRLHDGVLVGIGTVLADDPLLLPTPRTRRPFHRVVLDSTLRLPPSSRLARSARRSPVIVVCGRPPVSRRRRLEALGVRVVPVGGVGRPRPEAALKALWREGLRSLMVEGGAEVLGAFLNRRLVDEVALFRAPLLLGGRRALPAFAGPDPDRLADALRLKRRPATELGADAELVEVWYPE